MNLRKMFSAVAAFVFTFTTFGSYIGHSDTENKYVVNAESVRVEFEDGEYSSSSSADSLIKGYSGSGYVDMKEGSVSVEVNVDKTDVYNIIIGYCLPSDRGSKIQNLVVNGVTQSQINFAPSDTFKELTVANIKLNEGKNIIKIEKSWGWTLLDYLEVSTAVLPEISASDKLCDSKATAEAKSLMSYLVSVYGKNIISGQQEYYGQSREDEFEYIYELSGEYPAIRGFDFSDFCPLYAWDDGVSGRIIDWVEKGGIATASWHINVPVTMADYTLGSTMPFEKTTYSEKTDFVTANVVKEGTVEHDYFLLCVENLANELLKLQDANVPLIFRPFHEAEGNGGVNGEGAWFWWAKEGAEVYKELYIYLYDLLTNEYGLHNLIWEFNSYTYDKSYQWYPGAEYVDIIGYDKYNATNWTTGTVAPNESAIASTFYSLVGMYGDDGKPIAMSENDTIPKLENLVTEKAAWLYFCPWYGDHLMNTNYNNPDTVTELYKSDYVITLDELPKDLYKTSSSTPSQPGDSGDDNNDTPVIPADGKYELEKGVLEDNGGTKVQSDSGASGGKYVFLKDAGDSISIDVEVEEEGLYKLTFGYAQSFDKGHKIQDLYVNGTLAENVTFNYSADFTETSGTIVSLKAGKNTIKIVSSWGWTYLDYVTVNKAEATKVDATGATLSNENASPAAKSLYSYICQMYGNKIISGQQESTWMGSVDYEMDYIKDVTGKLPAMRGLDYMGDDFSGVNKRAIDWYNKGGIVTICWHCGSDFSDSYDDSKADDLDWDKALTEGTAEYEALIKAMDKGAQALTELKEAGVPVIWRPFHEFDGGWFWWGKGGAENFKKLWQIMYDRYTNHWDLDNLIWALGFTSSVPAQWYPGDEYVDIAGADTYVENDSSLIGMYNKVLDVVGTDMPIILHENGAIPDPEALVADGSNWASFMTWHTEWLTDSKWNTKESLKSVYTSDYVITIDELPDDLYTSDDSFRPGEEIIYGDLNNSGVADLTDLTILSLHLIGDAKLKDDQLKAADVNVDGEVNLADLAHFKQYISKDNVILGK